MGMTIIKGYEMPHNCYDCDLHNYHECDLTNESIEEDYCWSGDSREKHCPLREVEAIPKADYENRLKADLKAILVELQLEIHELENPYPHDYDNLLPLAQHNAFYDAKSTIEDLVEQKINELEGEHDPTPQN